MNEGISLYDGGLASIIGGSTYKKTVENIDKQEKTATKLFEQGLLDIEAYSQVQSLKIAQDAGKYGVSPSGVMNALLMAQQQTQATSQTIAAEFATAKEELGIMRENLEWARSQEQFTTLDTLSTQAAKGLLTQADFESLKRKHEIAFGEGAIDWEKIYSEVSGSFVTEEQKLATINASTEKPGRDWFAGALKGAGAGAAVGAGIGAVVGSIIPVAGTAAGAGIGAAIGGVIGGVIGGIWG